jgi:hypothetical protein
MTFFICQNSQNYTQNPIAYKSEIKFENLSIKY